ncbi:MAG: sigma-70 family RNA polymerase sigma factor [bacterium]|nr:sigma-70 family RNA polymerase sigma factor [bacterium]
MDQIQLISHAPSRRRHLAQELRQLSDEELIIKLQQGVEMAFDIIVERYTDKLRRFIFRIVKDQRKCEDIVQETFMKVYQHRDAYEGRVAKVVTWIYKIAENLAIDEYRRKRRHRVLESINGKNREGEEYEMILVDGNPLPGEGPKYQERYDELHLAVPSLPERYQEAIILRDFQELSYEKIAEITGLPLGTVKAHIFRGRQLLGRILSGERFNVVRGRITRQQRKQQEKVTVMADNPHIIGAILGYVRENPKQYLIRPPREGAKEGSVSTLTVWPKSEVKKYITTKTLLGGRTVHALFINGSGKSYGYFGEDGICLDLTQEQAQELSLQTEGHEEEAKFDAPAVSTESSTEEPEEVLSPISESAVEPVHTNGSMSFEDAIFVVQSLGGIATGLRKQMVNSVRERVATQMEEQARRLISKVEIDLEELEVEVVALIRQLRDSVSAAEKIFGK